MISRSTYIAAIVGTFYLSAFAITCNSNPEQSTISEQSSPCLVYLQQRLVALEALIAKLQQKSCEKEPKYHCSAEAFSITTFIKKGCGAESTKEDIKEIIVGEGTTEVAAGADAFNKCKQKYDNCRISQCKKVE
jgi:hypothetical protein